jgi:hypothetical protein
MDKCYASSVHRLSFTGIRLTSVAALLAASSAFGAINLGAAEAKKIGHKIWQNECNETVSGLTSWNAGEDFASLGIGHFIWYPEGRQGPFEESFPRLVDFVSSRGAKLPSILLRTGALHCPWNSRKEFLAAQDTTEMAELRQFLASTVDLQTQFLINRLESSLPKMLAETSAAKREAVRRRFEQLASSPRGCYALIDYVNFKGEGVLLSERYANQGWGLLQVLEEMNDADADLVAAFSHAAATVLTRRVHNSPPARGEARWLSGWIRRVNGYSRA